MSVYKQREAIRLFGGDSWAAKCDGCGELVCKYAFDRDEAANELEVHRVNACTAKPDPNTRFIIHVEGDYDLTVSDIWPDGDAPANPTAADVVKAMEASGHKSRVLNDWCLNDPTVTVYGPGRSGQSAEAWLVQVIRHSPKEAQV